MGRAKKIIQVVFFSKRSELFCLNFGVYFKNQKDAKFGILRKKIYRRFLGVGTNILGYGNKKVDNAVKKIIKLGNMSTLNCPELSWQKK